MVTLSEINITPLLDLAFVLLIIFVITTPLLEKGLDLNLPRANGQPDKPINPRNVRTVDISNTGVYVLNKQRLGLDPLVAQLAGEFKANPNLIIYIRADKDSRFDLFAQLVDACQRAGISRYSVRTAPVP